MKLIKLIALSVGASLFVAADVAWASDASPEKLDFESIRGTDSGRGPSRGPAEERMRGFTDAVYIGNRYGIEKIVPKIESADMGFEKVAEKLSSHVALPTASFEHHQGGDAMVKRSTSIRRRQPPTRLTNGNMKRTDETIADAPTKADDPETAAANLHARRPAKEEDEGLLESFFVEEKEKWERRLLSNK
ncbi:unnamed protein product [Hyaloperonospora brassicae]|uniref:RxLR effector candidate protein n=1 Tax=Hyaloperonospora brassicae TaxID=162125 RepID=A0AAV0UV66_HYABA|nr:unnamed protein product [Hyaloperonospora brassicae]